MNKSVLNDIKCIESYNKGYSQGFNDSARQYQELLTKKHITEPMKILLDMEGLKSLKTTIGKEEFNKLLNSIMNAE